MNKKLTSYIVISFFLCLAGLATASADNGENNRIALTVDKAVSMAFEKSEDLKIQDNELLRSQSKYKEGTSYLYPTVNGEVNWYNNIYYPDIPQNQFKRDYEVNAGLTVSQTIYTFGKVSSAIDASKKYIEISRLNREATRQEIIYSTRLAYYNAYLAKRALEIAEESYNTAKNNKRMLEGRAASGRASKRDNIKISADLASRVPVVNNARASLSSAMETLRVVIGANPTDKIELIDDLEKGYYPPLNREGLETSLKNNQPAIKALAQNIKAHEDLLKSKKAYYYPDISAFATWTHTGQGNDYYVGKDNLYDYGIAGVKMSVPIWTGGRTSERITQATIDKRNAELLHKKAYKEYLLELDKAINEYKEHINTLAANNEAVGWAGESLKLSGELFQSGQISVTDLNDASLMLTNEKINKEMTLFKLNASKAKIDSLTSTGEYP